MIEAHKLFCRNTLKLKPGQSGILSNGRLIGPFEDGEKFSEEDFHTLELFEVSSHGRALIDIVASVEIANLEADYDTASFRSDVQMKVASLLRRLPAQQRIVIPSVEDQHRCTTTCHVMSSSLCDILHVFLSPSLYVPTLTLFYMPVHSRWLDLFILFPCTLQCCPSWAQLSQWRGRGHSGYCSACICQSTVNRGSEDGPNITGLSLSLCACVRAYVHACMRVCVRVVCVHLYVAIRDSSCTISSPHPLAGVH